MSHQSGIQLSQSLRDVFGTANQSSSTRYIIAEIQGETVVNTKTASGSADWHADLDAVAKELTETEAKYVLFSKGDSWILMSHVPDKAKVKDKMLYASTRATVKRTLGANFFDEEMHGTLPSDFSRAGYEAFKAHNAAEVPLTRAEFTRKEELEAGEIYTGGAGAYVHGVSFPAGKGVMEALKGVAGSGANYVTLGVDTTQEIITLTSTKSGATVDTVRDNVSLSEPQFHFFRYGEKSVFIYTCPDGSGSSEACPIKKRMLYSSSKARVVALFESVGGSVDKTFEFNEPSEVDQTEIDNALYPPKVEAKATFTKPSRPGRGARKLIRK